MTHAGGDEQRAGAGDGDGDGDANGPDNMDKQHVRGSTLLLLGRLLSLGFTTATQIVIVRALSTSDYGVFAYALTLVASGRILLSLGQGRVLSRFMSTYEEQQDYPRMFGSMLLAVATIAVTSTVLLGGMAFLAGPVLGATFDEPRAVQVLLVLMFLAPMEALDQVFVSVFAVFSKPRAIFFRKYLLTPGLRLLVVLALAILGGDVIWLAVGYVLTSLLGIGIYLTLFVRLLREAGTLHHLRLSNIVWPVREVFSFSVPTMTNEVAILVTHMGTVVLLGLYQGATAVAAYRAVFPAARLNQVVYQTFVTLFLPMAARLHARGDYSGLRDAYWRSSVFLAVFTFPVFAMTGVFAQTTTVTLFGERYASSGWVLMALSTGYYVNMALGFNVYVLQIFGRLRYLVLSNLGVAALDLALALALIPRYGALGAAIATAVTMIGQNVVNQLVLTSMLRRQTHARTRYVRPYMGVTVVSAVLFALEALLDPGILGALALSTVAFLGVLRLSAPWLHLADTFPELMRIPLLRRVAG